MTRDDIAIVGGGPAGATCALRLAHLGFRPVLYEKGLGKRQHVGESLPSSIRVVWETLGLELPRGIVDARPPEHRVFWGPFSGGRREEPSSERETSLLIWRGPFDDFLRERAAAAGARLVASSVRGLSPSRDGYLLELGDGSRRRAGFVVDATGRSGLLARSYRRREKRFRTLALTGHFRIEQEEPPTMVESFRKGWVWSAPLSNGLRDVTAMLDAGRAPRDRRAMFRHALESTTNIRELVGSSPRVGPLRGSDATPYAVNRFCGRHFLLLGDAASFLDPLSAHGVHKAMDGALAAATVIRTILERPARTEVALRFYQERETNIYGVTTERLRRLYGQEKRFLGEPFWQARSAAEESATPLPSPRAPLRPEMRLRGAPGVEVSLAPVLEGEFIASREVLVTHGDDRPVRFLGTVCLPPLYREASSAESAGQAARGSALGFERAFAAIDWLYRTGYLEPRE